MSRSALLAAGFMAAGAMAQAAFAIEGWEYVGCVSAEPAQFPQYNPFYTAFTAQQCQDAFKGHRSYAALSPGGCYAADSGVTPVYTVVSDNLCNLPCKDNDGSANGYCGGSKDGNNQIFSLYKVKDAPKPDPNCHECDGKSGPKGEFRTVCQIAGGCGPYKLGDICPIGGCPRNNSTGPSIPCHPGCVDLKGDGQIVCTAPEGSCNGIPYGAVCPWESCHRDRPCLTGKCGVEIIVICENPHGCGSIKYGGPCPPEGCVSRCPPGGCKIVVCECEYGCGIIKKGYGCPAGGCPADNKPDICLIPEGCGPVKNGEACPPGGCKSSSITIICECEYGCGTIKKGDVCPPKGCPPDNKPVICLIPEGCGSVKHGEVCPPGGCKSSSITIVCECEYGCGTIKKGEVCLPTGCPPDNKPTGTTYVVVPKPTGTGSVYKPSEYPNKPVIVSGAEKLFASTFSAAAAFAVLGFNFA